ncbi:MAG: exosortase/archaeosortase family protein, partial [Candidatus Bathyarchaeota archaeon]|nr:exosortase/archaeosortase family protein [Candidatus Bathyarchaeota archaeon]
MNSFHLSSVHSKLALITKVSALQLIVLALYHQDLVLIANEALQSEIMSYMLAIPILFTYLIYRKRKLLRAAITFEPSKPNKKPTYTNQIIGSLLCFTAFLLYWHGSYTFYPLEYHMLSLPIFTSGLILIIFNTKTLRVLAFPITFLLLLTPPPTEIVSIAGAGVATLNSEISYNILKTIGLPVTQIAEYGAPALAITDPSGSQISFVVGIASSGIHSIIGFSIFAIFTMYVARGPTWKKATVLIASIPLIYTLTLTRIIILVSIGHWQGVNTAWDIFHLLGASALIFLAAIILLTLSEKIWKLQIFTTKPKTTPCPTCNPNTKTTENTCPACGKILKYPRINLSKQDLAKIAALILITTIIVTISVPVFALSEGPPEVLVQSPGNEQATTTQIFPKIPNYNLTFVYRDTQFEKIATRDRALVYAYTPTNTPAQTIFIVMEIGPSKSTWHSWEASVITWPQMHGHPYGTQLDLREIQLQQNPPLTGKLFAFKQAKTNTTQVVLYWYESALFNTGSSSEQKYVKTSLVAYPKNPHNITETEEMLLPFAKAIVDYWQPIKTWSQISLTIAQNGAPLTTIPTTLLAT